MIRLARQSDIDKIWQLRLQTTELLKERQIDQWQYIDPSIETFKKDIEQNEFFVYEVLGEIFGMIDIKFGF